jgi:hypothetical protein
MVRVSRNSLDKQVEKEISTQFIETLGRLSAVQSAPFISELLGEEEQIMLAKRLATIVLIHEDHSDYAIANTLKISNTTSAKLREQYNQGSFKSVIQGIKKNKTDYLDYVDTLVEIIHLGLPRYVGPGRWKLLKKQR